MTSFQEPIGYEIAGLVRYRRPPKPYERFMEEQEIPIVYGIGIYDVRNVTLAPWKRMGGNGAFIQLDGTEGRWGMYLVEVPAGGVLNAEKHLYEELMYVVEGRGTTEVWKEGSSKKQTFEWQAGTLFAIPINTWHRLVNATSSPALVLAATNAPILMNLFNNPRFIFEDPFDFSDRYDESDDYFRAREELEPHPVTKRAVRRSVVIPDIVNCELPLDNQRAPGYRRIQPDMAGNNFGLFIGQYPSGRYSKAHAHQSGAVLICLRGKGYTYTWPRELGMRPWEAGKGDLVKRQDYVPGGMVSAAPGGGDWFHQHFGVAPDYFRVLALLGPSLRVQGKPGDEVVAANEDITAGGATIPYELEDPHIRQEYIRALEREGLQLAMP